MMDERLELERGERGPSFLERVTAPHTYAILFFLAVLAVVGTWLLPAGEFDRVLNEAVGRNVVVPGTFKTVEQTPVSFFGLFIAYMEGFIEGADVVGFVFFAYTSWYVVLRTKALHAAVGAMLRAFGESQRRYIMPFFLFVFGFCASIFGMFEESFGFLPLFVGMAIAMGYDGMVGAATVAVGVGMGYSAAIMNPFTVILAQKCAELPLLSGWPFRLVLSLSFFAVSALYIARYAARVKADPTQSLLRDVDMGELHMDHDELVSMKFTLRYKLVCLICLGAVGVLMWGVIAQGWYFNELGALFVLMGILGGMVGGLGINGTAKAFADGFCDIAAGCLLIAFGRTMLVILQKGHIIDTMAYYCSLPLSVLPKWLAAEGMLVVQNLINFFIPSGSGQAVVTMPIMAPLADLLGISRQVAVLAFQFGDGLSNVMWPTADIPIICAIAHIPLNKWYKFFLPLFGIGLLMQAIGIAAAVLLGL